MCMHTCGGSVQSIPSPHACVCALAPLGLREQAGPAGSVSVCLYVHRRAH